MEKFNKTELSKAFYCLPANRLTEVQDDICGRLDWSLTTFNNKKSGRSPISQAERAVLIVYFKELGIDFGNGLPIFYR